MKKSLLAISALLASFSIQAQWVQTNGLYTVGPITVMDAVGDNLFAGASCSLGEGRLDASIDDGTTWATVQTGLDTFTGADELEHMGTVLFFTGYDYQSGDGLGVCRSFDYGATWTPCNNGLPANPFCPALLVDGTTLWVGCNSGTLTKIYKSLDSGATWTQSSAGASGNTFQCMTKCGSDYFVGTNNGIYRSTNGGANWSQLTSFPTGTIVWQMETSGNAIIASTYGSAIYRSTNQGNTWTLISGTNGLPTNSSFIYDIYTMGNNVFVGVQATGVWASWNNGANWVCLNTPGFACQCSAITSDATYLYVGGNAGNDVWRYALGQFLEVTEQASANVNVFPNPFTTLLTLEFDHSMQGAQITMTDTNGKVIRDELFTGARWSADFGDIERGVYFIFIREENGTESVRKVIAQ